MNSKKTPARIVLIDLDDTLVHRGDFNARAMQATLRDFGHRVSLSEILSTPDERELLGRYGCEWEPFWRHFDVHDNRALGFASGNINPYHDAHAFLQEISTVAQAIIITDTVPHKATFEIETFEFGQYLTGTVMYELGKPGIEPKPDVSVALRALETAGYHPLHQGAWPNPLPSNDDMDHIWIVGDSIKDMQLGLNLRRHLSRNGIHAIVHTILIKRWGDGVTADYIPFGPHPLYTAGRLIQDHGHCTHPLNFTPEVCAPDLSPDRIAYPGDEYGDHHDMSPQSINPHKTDDPLLNKGFTRPLNP